MKIASMIAFLALGTPHLAAAGETWRELSRLQVSPAGLRRIEVHNARGRVEARPSRDGNLHVIALKVVREISESKARAAAQQIVVQVGKQDGRYVIEVRYPRNRSVHVDLWKGFDTDDLPRLEVRLTLEVPQDLALEVRTASGDVFTESLAATQVLESSSGDVEVDDARGGLEIETSSGDVRISGARTSTVRTASGDVEVPASVQGPLSIHTSSGDVSVAGAMDSLSVESVSGDISVRRGGRDVFVKTGSGEVSLGRISGSVEVETASGDVEAGLAAPLREATFTTSSGDVRLGLVGGLGCQADLMTRSGSIDVDLPARTTSYSRRHMSAIVGGGGAPVRLRSASGSLTVTRGEP